MNYALWRTGGLGKLPQIERVAAMPNANRHAAANDQSFKPYFSNRLQVMFSPTEL
jgi:hypothetical protein